MVVEFALALMAVLDQINRESFQRFRLRIGLNHGPVIAGVIGAQKPQYVSRLIHENFSGMLFLNWSSTLYLIFSILCDVQ